MADQLAQKLEATNLKYGLPGHTNVFRKTNDLPTSGSDKSWQQGLKAPPKDNRIQTEVLRLDDELFVNIADETYASRTSQTQKVSSLRTSSSRDSS